ncbi:smad nuclear interacting protein 1-like [Ylistrum balloti]|uniref:smad nuclear interacting protein 1-like n=1 Tax=Ylistrum balloti TaxID=509963 RepID=UPI002905D2F8|nr:smad nuclear interacting protein 1-like [Ylistrum balloti]
MVRSYTSSDDEEETRTRRKHQKRQSHSRSPKRESKHGKKKKKSKFDESRSSSRSPPPKRKIKMEQESPEYEQGERTHSRKHHREDRDRRKQEHKHRNEERFDPHRRIKQEPDDDARGHRRDNEMREQRRERDRNDDRRREARRQRGNNPFRTEDDGFVYGQQQEQGQKKTEEPKDKDKPDFKLSGKLTEDTNTYRGVVIKYNQPPEARKPKKRWRLYPFKGDEALPVLHIHRMSAYLMGRDRLVVDIPTDHPSCSKQHAVLQYRLVNFEREDGTTGRKVAPYIIDLDSSNGTYVNNQRIDPQRYVELFEKDMLKFGFSSREYILLHEKTDTSELAEDSGSGSDN